MMSHVEFFKRQAKYLLKDYKTKKPSIDDVGNPFFDYEPKHFDVDGILLDYNFDENDFSLMKAQHVIALMVGFSKWSDLFNASANELELAKLIFDNRVNFEEWEMYIAGLEVDNRISFDAESRLDFFKEVFIKKGLAEQFKDYHYLNQGSNSESIRVERKVSKPDLIVQITSLPLDKAARAEFIEEANSVFEEVLGRIAPRNPEKIRKLWNVEDYVDKDLLQESMLPVSKDYALSLIDAFLVHHVLRLATKADEMAERI